MLATTTSRASYRTRRKRAAFISPDGYDTSSRPREGKQRAARHHLSPREACPMTSSAIIVAGTSSPRSIATITSLGEPSDKRRVEARDFRRIRKTSAHRPWIYLDEMPHAIPAMAWPRHDRLHERMIAAVPPHHGRNNPPRRHAPIIEVRILSAKHTPREALI